MAAVTTKIHLYHLIFSFLAVTCTAISQNGAVSRGQWALLHGSIGISAMHMQLLHDDTVVIFDRTNFGLSNLSLPTRHPCRVDSTFGLDCTAHSLLYDVVSDTYRPLFVLTDTWCSSGSVVPDGRLIQTGGYGLGERVIRTFSPCGPTTLRVANSENLCDWRELNSSFLSARRWYASNQILPSGHVIIVGGRASHSYEFFPKSKPGSDPVYFRFLAETRDGRDTENNLYPFLHLLPNGNLFIFANNRSIEFNYKNDTVLKQFPVMPGGAKRNYPSTGSSVLLPLRMTDVGDMSVEVLICGGAAPESFFLAETEKVYVAAANTCGRMRVTDPQPQWYMEEMPMPRVMSDMVLLPTGDVILINGASNGTAGWDNADNPVLHPVLYKTYEPDPTQRFEILNPTQIPRMYHSSAVLVPDGRILVGGSNPNPYYNFTGVRYPTQLSLEAFSPHYLEPEYGPLRPEILAVESGDNRVLSYGQEFSIMFTVEEVPRGESGTPRVTMLMPPFQTHSYGMNQRVVVLHVEREDQVSAVVYKVTVRAPRNVNVAPPGYYMVFVVNGGVPSHGVWVHLRPGL